jgi:hypothetical protein
MVELELTKALRVFLEKVVCNFRLQTKAGELEPPKIVNGFLPPKGTNEKDDFPFVIVRPVSGSADRDLEQIKISILIGGYSEEYDEDGHSVNGFEYCLNVISRIKQEIFKLPGLTLAGKYQVNFPFSWSLDEEQPWPYWFAEVETNWTFRSPENEDQF